MPPITNDWQQPLEVEFKKPYYKDLYKKVLKNTGADRFFRIRMISLMPFI